MWSRGLFRAGVSTSFVAAALVAGGLWLGLYGLEQAGSRFPPLSLLKELHVLRGWMLPGLPAACLYAVCWHRVIFRQRDYSPRRTWWLIVVSYLMAMIVGTIGIFTFVAFGMLTTMTSLAELPAMLLALAFMAFVAGMAYMPLAGALLFVPYLIVAVPVAFLQRALLLQAFGAETRVS